MAVLTVTPITFGVRTPGAIPTYDGTLWTGWVTPSVGGDSFLNNGRTFIFADNNSGAPITITATCTRKNNQGVTENMVANVINSASITFHGPFPAVDFNDDQGMVNILCSSVTSVLISVFELAEKGRG